MRKGSLIGFGRAISDGAYQSAVYDCAVIEEFQGKGLGKILMEKILFKLEILKYLIYLPLNVVHFEKLIFFYME